MACGFYAGPERPLFLSPKWLRSAAPEGTATILWQPAGSCVISFSLKACLLVARLKTPVKLCAKFSLALCVDTLEPFFLDLILLFVSFHRFPNTTHEGFNVTLHTSLVVTTKLVLPTPAKPILPVQTGEQAQQEEQSSGMTIFFSLLVLGECRHHRLPSCVSVRVVWLTPFKPLLPWSNPPSGFHFRLRDYDSA